MNKVQRTIQLPPEIFDFAKDEESISGPKFNRQVLAAMLMYYFNDSGENWISAAVAVERGDIVLSGPGSSQALYQLRDLAKQQGVPIVCSPSQHKDGAA